MARARATNPPARLNRVLLAVVGIVLLAAGSIAAAVSTGRLGLASPDGAILPGGSLPTWSTWIVLVVGTVVGLLALAWTLTQARRRPAGVPWTATATGAVAGRTTASSSAVADALQRDLVAHPAIADATARLTAPAPAPTLAVELAVPATADAAEARAHLEQFALPRLRTALGVGTLPTELLLRTARGTGRDERRVA